jgi:ectoine hydroxylase
MSTAVSYELPETPENIDHYPSRQQDKPGISKRKDPVVYGTPEGGPLTREQLDSYDTNGYLFFESLFSPDDVKALLDEVNSLKQQRDDIDPEYVIREKDSGDIRSFFHIHDYNPVFKALAANPKLAGAAEQILASKVYLHQSRINLKPGFRGREFYWHSDFETWHTEDGMPQMRALSCTINLTENTEHNGPLMLIPGSHKSFVSCVGETPENHYKKSLKKQEYGVPDERIIADMVNEHGITACKAPPGSVVLFDCNILHGSNSNITPTPRNNVFFVYNSILNILRDPYCGQKPRPEHIASRLRCETV